MISAFKSGNPYKDGRIERSRSLNINLVNQIIK